MNGAFFSFFSIIEPIKESQCLNPFIEICRVIVQEGFRFWPW